MSVYYNEIDLFAAEWLRWLIKAGEIPDGTIDTRSIVDVRADEIRDYDQCHFFAGISGWPVALGRAGWSPGRRVWTGSCPCPPFSAAGRKKACPKCSGIRPIPCPRRTGVFICIDCEHAWYADGRHLYPEFHRLIVECGPPVVFIEQVAGGDGLIWLAGVRARLERSGYALGAADLPAACVGSPNIRQRLWGCAVRVEVAMCGGRGQGPELEGLVGGAAPAIASHAGGMGDAGQQPPRRHDAGEGSGADPGVQPGRHEEGDEPRRLGGSRWLADAGGELAAGVPGIEGVPRGELGAELGVRGAAGGLEYADSPGRGEQRGAEPVRSEQPSAERTGDSRGMDHSSIDGHRPGADPGEQPAAGRGHGGAGGSGSVGRMGDAGGNVVRRDTGGSLGAEAEGERGGRVDGRGGDELGHAGAVGGMDDTASDRAVERRAAEPRGDGPDDGVSRSASPWDQWELVYCGDDKWRRIPRRLEPGLQRVADGLPVDLDLLRIACQTFPRTPKVKGRVGVLRGFGNAINPYVAAGFIRLCERWINGERR